VGEKEAAGGAGVAVAMANQALPFYPIQDGLIQRPCHHTVAVLVAVVVAAAKSVVAAAAIAAVAAPAAAVVVLKTWKIPYHTADSFYPHLVAVVSSIAAAAAAVVVVAAVVAAAVVVAVAAVVAVVAVDLLAVVAGQSKAERLGLPQAMANAHLQSDQLLM